MPTLILEGTNGYFLSDACYFCIQTGTGYAAAAQTLKKPT